MRYLLHHELSTFLLRSATATLLINGRSHRQDRAMEWLGFILRADNRGEGDILMDRDPLSELAGPVLLYDGTCGLCTRLVQWVLRTDRHGAVRFAPLQGELARRARLRHPELGQADSVVWLEPFGGSSRAFLRSEAVLRLWTYLGGKWRLVALGTRWLPRSLRDWLYDQFAIRRKKWFGPADACQLPTPEQRGRMLE